MLTYCKPFRGVISISSLDTVAAYNLVYLVGSLHMPVSISKVDGNGPRMKQPAHTRTAFAPSTVFVPSSLLAIVYP
jgi:hypothetical protein